MRFNPDLRNTEIHSDTLICTENIVDSGRLPTEMPHSLQYFCLVTALIFHYFYNLINSVNIFVDSSEINNKILKTDRDDISPASRAEYDYRATTLLSVSNSLSRGRKEM